MDKYRSRLLFFEKHYGRSSIWLLAFDLILHTILVYAGFGISHLIARRPRDPEYFKEPVRMMWKEMTAFLKRGQGK